MCSTAGEPLVERDGAQALAPEVAVEHERGAPAGADSVHDLRRARDDVAGGEEPRLLGALQGDRVDLRVALAPHPDGDDRDVARELVRLRLVVLRVEAPVRAEDRRAALQLDRAHAILAGESSDPPGVVENDAFGDRLLDLELVRGHLAVATRD